MHAAHAICNLCSRIHLCQMRRKRNAALAQSLRDSAIRKTLLDRGAEPVGNTPAEHADFIKSGIEKWRRVAQSAGLKPE